MCGIAGVVERPGERAPREALEAMGDALAHRGPDDRAVRCYGRAGLSFRRLSIIDVAGGAQPLDDESGRRHLILNGEIYNHRDLRRDLEARGHRFRTDSDVEAVVHGYEEFGDDVVRRLRGMFAFALWDEDQQRLLLARDRLGEKPLVYYESGGRLAFASELQGLLQDRRIPREPDFVAIHHYLTYQYVPWPLTAFAGIHKLPPGHLLVYQDGRARVERYWSLPFAPQLRIAEEEAATEVRRLLREAVRLRLMSEVPLGAFLSGGLDSSAIVALMAEFGKVKTFSVGFQEDSFNELGHARLVAKSYATEHHELVVRPHAAEVLPALVEHYGEPYADSSALPTYYLARETGAHVTVALNGDGSDELFAGYSRYRLVSLSESLDWLPAPRGLWDGLWRRGRSRLPARAERLLRSMAGFPEEGYARAVSCFAPEEKDALYSPDMKERVGGSSYAVLYARYRECDAPDFLGRTLYVDTTTYLPGDLLAKIDIATMAHGLEARSPFLDHPLVEFAARLPSRYKLRGRIGKHILRRAVADLLPPQILRRVKQGFGVPISRWLRSELNGMLRDALLSPQAAKRLFFRAEQVQRLVVEHETGRRDHGARLWALLMLELWCRRFLDGRPS
jgi:asparagine synthase (glutamine-hydrolysing)